MSMLDKYHKTEGVERNKLLFSWLCDDKSRNELYEELQRKNFPVLQFKSLLQARDDGHWRYQDVYFVSSTEDVQAALKGYSVRPYQELDSGGKFMLGLDDVKLHRKQRKVAEWAFRIASQTGEQCPRHGAIEHIGEREHLFASKEISECARAAVRRAAVRPLDRAARKENSHEFDLTIDVAQQAALQFVKLLFGFREEAQGVLQRVALGAYQRLVFQIHGRHFVSQSDAGLPRSDSSALKKIKSELADEIHRATRLTSDEPFREGAPGESVIKKLDRCDGLDREMLEVIVAGLIAGTVGNVQAAVPIVIYHFFTQKAKDGRPLIDTAREAARFGGSPLENLICEALRRNPPAAFLTRTSDPIAPNAPTLFQDHERSRPIPKGAHLLLAMGADPRWGSIFGGDHVFMHNCVGRDLAWPLIVEIVRHVLQLPGLAQVIDPQTGKPCALTKRWGVICEPYKLQYQRDRLLNQQPLYVVLPIKPPVEENAKILLELTRAGAHIVEASLKESGIVHFAWFMLVENGTHLALSTVFDGDFDAYVEHFAVKVPLFDKQFEYLAVEQRTPIREHPKQFVENIRKYNKAPFADYLFSAYPTVTVADVINATSGTSHSAVAASDAIDPTAATAHSVVKEVVGGTREKHAPATVVADSVDAPSDFQ